VADYIYISGAGFLAVFLTAGTAVLAPPTVRKLEIARICFCLAGLCLVLIAVTFVAAASEVELWKRLAAGAVSGAITGAITYAMWLGIDNEIAELEHRPHEQ
jgi:hypothetical protein